MNRLGHYELRGLLGKGGMGEVYRARDTKLNRDVALRILPEAFAHDPDRMARFEREAQVLASLNHPNVAAIYSVEQGALVMELVEGDTLKVPQPLETALNYARQISDALQRSAREGHRAPRPEARQHHDHAGGRSEGVGFRSCSRDSAPRACVRSCKLANSHDVAHSSGA